MASYDIIVKAVDQTKGTFNSIEKGLGSIDAKAKKFNDTLSQGISRAGAVAGLALAALTRSALGYAGAVNDAAENTGIAVQSILALGQALTTNGGDATKATDAVNKFTEAVGTANGGSKELRETFAKVGVSLNDLKTLGDTALFEKTLAGLSQIGDATKRNSLQSDIFGKTLKGANVAGFGADISKLAAAQRENAAAIIAAGKATDSLKSAFNTVSVAVVKALSPITNAINNLGQDKIDKIVDSFIKLGAAAVALTGFSKVLGVVASVTAAFGAAWLTATKGVAMLTLAFASFNKTLVIAGSYIARFSAGVGATTTVAGLLGKLMARIPFVITAVGLALGGLLRFIPYVGLIVTALYAVNEAIKFAFDIDPIDYFTKKVMSAYNAVKNFITGAPAKTTTAADFQRTDKDTTPVALPSAAVADRTQKDISLLGQLSEAYAKAKQEYNELSSAIGNVKDINFQSKLFEELSSRAEQLGKVAIKPTALIMRDFNLELDKTAEKLRQQNIEYSDVDAMVRKLSQGLESSSFALMEQEILLGNNTLIAEKFRQEMQASRQALTEQSIKLTDASYQQTLFSQSIIATKLNVEQQTITLGKLNDAFSSGRLTLEEYADGLGNINERLLGVTEKTTLLNAEYAKNIKNSEDSSAILANLTAQYQSGAIGLDEYAKKLSMVSYEYENLSTVTAKALKAGNDEIRTQDLSTQSAKDLTDQLRAGTLTWRQYQNTINKLDSTGVQKSFINIENEILKAKSLGEALGDALNESTKKAGDALADNLTAGIMKGQLRLSSFKDFFGSILNDITAMLIKKQFVSPIVDALTGAMGSKGAGGGGLLNSILGSVGGGGGGGLGDFFGGIGDWFGGFFATGGYLPGGKLGIAGEAGPELIAGPANITPINQSMGSTPIVNFTINAIDTQTGVEFLMKNKPQIIGMVQQGFNSQGQRGIYA